MRSSWPLLALLLLSSCSQMEQAEKEKLKRRNAKAEPIYRSEKDTFAPLTPPAHQPRGLYPWESESNLPRITKDFFRCKGNPLNPPLQHPEEESLCLDCGGRTAHGLPIIHGKEGVYPILLELLNYLQKKTGRRVVITCGHRCPTHNTYADPGKKGRFSKHQLGAEVDFYLQGMEERPQEVVGWIMQYYQEHYKESAFTEFRRYDKGDVDVSIQPWFNQEIFLKIYQKGEGRDGDNQHPHPYLSIQVRYDRQARERVLYNWERAHKGYPRS